MEQHIIKLSSAQKKRLDDKFPTSPGNTTTELRAEKIAKIYLKKKYAGCKITKEGTSGCDLVVTTESITFEVGVKGTKQEHIAWDSLKINGKPSHKKLLKDLPMYRVTGVFKDEPKILILKYSEDFDMIQEDRWRTRAKKV